MSIVTLDEAKLQLNIDLDNDSDDGELQFYVDGITDVAEDKTNRVLAPREITERLALRGARRFRLWRKPVIELTSLTSLDGSLTYDVTTAAMYVDRDTGLVDVLAGSAPTGLSLAVYQAGYDPVPEKYRRGALVILQHVWESQRGAGGIASGVMGADDYERLRISGQFYSIPKKALEWMGQPDLVVG